MTSVFEFLDGKISQSEQKILNNTGVSKPELEKLAEDENCPIIECSGPYIANQYYKKWEGQE